ncbi:MAG: hypothetical protein ACXWNN_13660 [Candidatus Binataceae bacterium]
MSFDAISDVFDRIESEWQRRLPRALYPTTCWQDYRAYVEHHGYIADTRIGLGVLRETGGAQFNGAEIAQMLDQTLRHFGYNGGHLRVHDFRDERTSRATLLFFDEDRFPQWGEAVRAYLQDSTLRSLNDAA